MADKFAEKDMETVEGAVTAGMPGAFYVGFPESAVLAVAGNADVKFSEETQNGLLILSGCKGKGASRRKHKTVCRFGEGRAADKKALAEMAANAAETGWYTSALAFKNEAADVTFGAQKCFVEFVPTAVNVIRYSHGKKSLTLIVTDAALTDKCAARLADKSRKVLKTDSVVLIATGKAWKDSVGSKSEARGSLEALILAASRDACSPVVPAEANPAAA